MAAVSLQGVKNSIAFLLICISDFLQGTYTGLVIFLNKSEIGNKIYHLCPNFNMLSLLNNNKLLHTSQPRAK